MSAPALDLHALTPTLHELIVLAALRQRPRHGYDIARVLAERSDGALEIQYGTLYPILHRLESRHLVTATWSEGTGRRRRVYRLTHAGSSRLRDESVRLRSVFYRLLRLVSS
jgi:DNA-binding PadR family transcriptional regulator